MPKNITQMYTHRIIEIVPSHVRLLAFDWHPHITVDTNRSMHKFCSFGQMKQRFIIDSDVLALKVRDGNDCEISDALVFLLAAWHIASQFVEMHLIIFANQRLQTHENRHKTIPIGVLIHIPKVATMFSGVLWNTQAIRNEQLIAKS